MQKLQENLQKIYGEKAEKWLEDLPHFIKKISFKFDLTELKPLENLTHNYVASGLQNNYPIVLKLSLDPLNLKKEAVALKCFANYGGVKIIAEDEGLLILEQAIPGISLKSYYPDRENESIDIFCKLIKKLQQAEIKEKYNFPQLKDWLNILDKNLNLPEFFLDQARKLRSNLLSSNKNNIPLHGDLHHENILQKDHSWIIIDPKGVIGDPYFDLTAFICNPIPELLLSPNPEKIISHRIHVLAAQLDLDPHKITAWCLLKTILSWAWALEDNLDYGYWEKITLIIARIIAY